MCLRSRSDQTARTHDSCELGYRRDKRTGCKAVGNCWETSTRKVRCLSRRKSSGAGARIIYSERSCVTRASSARLDRGSEAERRSAQASSDEAGGCCDGNDRQQGGKHGTCKSVDNRICGNQESNAQEAGIDRAARIEKSERDEESGEIEAGAATPGSV